MDDALQGISQTSPKYEAIKK